MELTEAQYDCKQSKHILCCHRKKIRSSQISGEIKQGTEWKTGSSHRTMQGSQQFSFTNSRQILKPVSSTSQEEISVMQLFPLSSIQIHLFIHFFLCLPQFCPSGLSERTEKRCSIHNFPLILCPKPPSKSSQPAMELGWRRKSPGEF